MHTTEWELLWRLGLSLVLSTVTGLEREYGFAVSDLNFQRHDEDVLVVHTAETDPE